MDSVDASGDASGADGATPGGGRQRPDRLDLRGQWDAQADEWIAWARAPMHDSYWRFHRDQFLQIIPGPGVRTLDLGCGEGRLSRDLAARDHDVVGADGSPAMAAAACGAEPAIPVVVADAAALPFADASFDLVVAFMSLQDVGDLDGALHETARVLRPGGRLAMAIVHPLNSAGTFAARAPDSPFVIDGSYLDPSFYVDRAERDGLGMTFSSAHRPLQTYVRGLAAAGFLVEDLREPSVPAAALDDPSGRRWQRVPLFLHLRAVQPIPRATDEFGTGGSSTG